LEKKIEVLLFCVRQIEKLFAWDTRSVFWHQLFAAQLHLRLPSQKIQQHRHPLFPGHNPGHHGLQSTENPGANFNHITRLEFIRGEIAFRLPDISSV
jgi:hypothetical protein